MVDTPIIPPRMPAQTGLTPVTSQGQNPPPLPDLPAGTTLNGTVTGFDSKGNPQILTDALRLVMKTAIPMQKGSYLVMRLEQPLKPDVLPAMRIVSVDGKQITERAPTTAPTQTPAQPVNSAVQNNLSEIAKPIGVLLDAVSRPLEEQGKGVPVQGQPKAEAPVAPQARELAATQIDVKAEGARLPAQLLKVAGEPVAPPAVLKLLQNAAAALTQQPGQQTLPPLTAQNLSQWLKPGMLVQLKLVNILIPAAQAVQNLPLPGAADSVETPLPAPAQTGYSAYAKAAPPTGSVIVPGATPAPSALQAPAQPAALPVATTTPATPAASTSPAAAPTAAPNVPQAFSPAQATQILQQAQAQNLPSNQMAAVVVGNEKSGALVVQTQLGTFSLPVASTAPLGASVGAGSLAPGTVLQVEVQSVKLAQAMQPRGLPAALAGVGAFTTASQLTADWSALNELVSLVQAMPAAHAAEAMQRIVPQAGANLTAGMVFFLSVLRRGDVNDWLGGDLTNRLKQMGRGDLIERLGGDLTALRSVWSEGMAQQQQQTNTNWQAFFFPVMVDKNLHTARMFVKAEEEDKKKQGGTSTRFVVELDLSNLGPMQLDGLLKKREMKSYFDLVIRTLNDLPNDIQNDILTIFERSQKATGLGGSIYFRKEVEFPVNPLEEMAVSSTGKSGDHGSIMA